MKTEMFVSSSLLLFVLVQAGSSSCQSDQKYAENIENTMDSNRLDWPMDIMKRSSNARKILAGKNPMIVMKLLRALQEAEDQSFEVKQKLNRLIQRLNKFSDQDNDQEWNARSVVV